MFYKNRIDKIIRKIMDYFFAKSYFYLGALCCIFKGYNLYNFSFNFKEPSLGGAEACTKKNNNSSLVNDRINLACKIYLSSKYYKLGEKERRNFIGSRIWGSHAGKNWHTEIEKIYISHGRFIEDRKNLIDSMLSLKADDYDRIIEIGTGNGWFLDILSKKINNNIEFIGMDLNPEIIEMAKTKYKDNVRLHFLCSDINKFVKAGIIKRSVIVSCFVLEYFSSQELVAFYEILKNNAPCYLAIIERVSIKHKNKRESMPIGDFSYSHDYERIFESFGMRNLYCRKEAIKNEDSCFNITALFKI